MDSHRLALRC
jgi:glutaminyl-peptide cyclotransferase